MQARSVAQGFRCPGVMELTADSVGWGPKNPVLAAPRPEPKGRPCPKPEGLCAHGAGLGAGWGGLASGRCFSPSVGRQRLPLSLSWDFAAGLPLSAALELIPSAKSQEMEADIEFFPDPKKPKALTCRKPRSPQRRVCLERFASARDFHGRLLCSPAGLRPCVLYHYRQLILHQPYFKFSKPTI